MFTFAWCIPLCKAPLDKKEQKTSLCKLRGAFCCCFCCFNIKQMEKKQKKNHGIDDQGKKKTARVAKNIWTTTVGTDTFSSSWLSHPSCFLSLVSLPFSSSFPLSLFSSLFSFPLSFPLSLFQNT